MLMIKDVMVIGGGVAGTARLAAVVLFPVLSLPLPTSTYILYFSYARLSFRHQGPAQRTGFTAFFASFIRNGREFSVVSRY